MGKRTKKQPIRIDKNPDFFSGRFIDWVEAQGYKSQGEILELVFKTITQFDDEDNLKLLVLGNRFGFGGEKPTEELLELLKNIDQHRWLTYESVGSQMELIEKELAANTSLMMYRESQIAKEKERIEPLLEAAKKRRDDLINSANIQYAKEVAEITRGLHELESFNEETQKAAADLKDQHERSKEGMTCLEEEDELSKAFQAQLMGNRHFVIIDADFSVEMLWKIQFNQVVTTNREVEKNPFLVRVADLIIDMGSPDQFTIKAPKTVDERMMRIDGIAALTIRFYHEGKGYELMLGKAMKKALDPFFKELRIPWTTV